MQRGHLYVLFFWLLLSGRATNTRGFSAVIPHPSPASRVINYWGPWMRFSNVWAAGGGFPFSRVWVVYRRSEGCQQCHHWLLVLRSRVLILA